jgi:hypothetical protein
MFISEWNSLKAFILKVNEVPFISTKAQLRQREPSSEKRTASDIQLRLANVGRSRKICEGQNSGEAGVIGGESCSKFYPPKN